MTFFRLLTSSSSSCNCPEVICMTNFCLSSSLSLCWVVARGTGRRTSQQALRVLAKNRKERKRTKIQFYFYQHTGKRKVYTEFSIHPSTMTYEYLIEVVTVFNRKSTLTPYHLLITVDNVSYRILFHVCPCCVWHFNDPSSTNSHPKNSICLILMS